MYDNDKWDREFYLQSPIYNALESPSPYFSGFTTWPNLNDYNAFLAQQSIEISSTKPAVLKCVPQAASPTLFEQQYESRIYLHGELQTREENWHDFFNLMAWSCFPRSKAMMNQYQYKAGLKNKQINQKQRSKEQNYLTLLDECGVIVVSTSAYLLELLRNFQWKTLFWQKRQQVIEQMRFYTIGHALYEKARQPYIGFTGKAVLQQVDDSFLQQSNVSQVEAADALLVEHLSLYEQRSNTKQLSPLPLLGIPGWHEANQSAIFYDNTAYFRPGRKE